MGGDGLGVGVAFEGEDAVGEGVGGVLGEDGAGFLEEGWAGVVGVVGEVDGAAGGGFVGVDDGLVDVVAVHALAAELGEQGGVDVEDAVGVVVGDNEQGEEASEDEQVGLGVAAGGENGVGEGVLVGVLLAGQDVDGQAAVFGALDAFAVVVGGDDAGDGGVEGACGDAVVEVEEGRAPAGEGNGEAWPADVL